MLTIVRIKQRDIDHALSHDLHLSGSLIFAKMDFHSEGSQIKSGVSFDRNDCGRHRSI